MTSLSLRERFERLGPVRGIDRVVSGSPASLLLVPVADRAQLKTVSAAIELARRGIPLLRAKRTLEEMLDSGRAYVRLPVVEDVAGLIETLRGMGVVASVTAPPDTVDVKAIRERLGLTQEQFALRFRIDPDALRNWESRRRAPDPMARSLLRVIERDPDYVEEILSVG